MKISDENIKKIAEIIAKAESNAMLTAKSIERAIALEAAREIAPLLRRLKIKISTAAIVALEKKIRAIFVFIDEQRGRLLKTILSSVSSILKTAIISVPSAKKDEVLEDSPKVLALIGIDEKGKVLKNGAIDNAISTDKIKSRVRVAALNAYLSGADEDIASAVIRSATSNAISSNFVPFFSDDLRAAREAKALDIAKKYDLEYFVYTGGLIPTSRAFCVKRNRKVFSVKDTEKWKDDPTLPVKERNTYNPITQRGGHNCRHFLMWITKEEAEERGHKDFF